jgi:transcriptional regulator ATRX
MNGLSSDASPYAVRVSHERSKKLNALIGPYMQRKDSSTLRKELPPIQEVVLHVRQSRTQSRLYRAFASYKKRKNITNFFKNWQMIRPLHNHPGTLLLKEQKENKGGGTRDSPRERLVGMDVEPEIVGIATDTEEDAEFLETTSTSTVADDSKGFEENVSPLEANGAKKVEKSADANKAGKPPPTDAVNSENWWQKTADRHGGVDRMNEVEQGYKVVLLLHILVEAQAIGDKVLVFSQCLRTLDFLERVFGLEDWTEHVPSLSSPLPAEGKRGGWVKGRDYLRIDGETNFSKRGDLIARFNDGKSLPGQGAKSDGVDEVKAFLLSSTVSLVNITWLVLLRRLHHLRSHLFFSYSGMWNRNQSHCSKSCSFV